MVSPRSVAVILALIAGSWIVGLLLSTPDQAIAPPTCTIPGERGFVMPREGTVVAVAPRLKRVWFVERGRTRMIQLPPGLVARKGDSLRIDKPLKSRDWPGDMAIERGDKFDWPWADHPDEAKTPGYRLIGRLERRRDEGNEWWFHNSAGRFLLERARWDGPEGVCVVLSLPNHPWVRPGGTRIRLGHPSWLTPYYDARSAS